MQTYTPPLRDMRFVLFELHGAQSLTSLPGYQEATPDLFQSVLEAAGSFMTEKLLPRIASSNLRIRSASDASGPA